MIIKREDVAQPGILLSPGVRVDSLRQSWIQLERFGGYDLEDIAAHDVWLFFPTVIHFVSLHSTRPVHKF